MKPTKEQIQKFWEWCGFWFDGTFWVYGKQTPDKMFLHQPSLDLNNLFRYAVPKAVLKYMADYRVPESRAISYLFQAWQLEYRKVRQFEIALFNVLWLVAFGGVIK